MPPEPADVKRRERRLAAAAIAILVVLYLAQPLQHLADKTYTAADMTQTSSLTRLGEARRPTNALVGDTVVQFQPWSMYARDVLRSGELPLWNPYNGCGAPLWGNYQSAVLSPFNLPYLVLSFKLAVLASAALKILVAAWFTWLFLRELGLSSAAALLGAAVYPFTGQMVTMLGFPHAGVVALLPATLWCVERAVANAERGLAPRRRLHAAVGLCAALTAALYAGHPEAFAVVLVLTATYAATRLVRAWSLLGRDRAALARVARPALAMVVAGLLAAGFAAPQILPFLEYMRESITLVHRKPLVLSSIADHWPLTVFPDALGNPRPGWTFDLGLPDPNYLQVNSAYTTGTMLLLALCALATLRSDRRGRFFATAAIVWLVVTCNVLNLGELYSDTSWIAPYLALWRTQPVWMISIAVLAAIAFERLAPGPGSWMRALALLAAGSALLAVTVWGARMQLAVQMRLCPHNLRAGILHHVREQERWIAVAFAAALLAACGLLLVRGRRLRVALQLAVIAAVFAQGGWFLHSYNPTVADELVFPRTEAIRKLQETVGESRSILLADNGMPPSTNLPYRLATLQNYDALGVRGFEQLMYTFFEPQTNWRVLEKARPNALALFGVEYVLTCGDWVPIGTSLGTLQLQRGRQYIPAELGGERSAAQEFDCERPGLDAVAVLVGTLAVRGPGKSDLVVRLVDVADGRTVAERSLTAEEVRASAFTTFDLALGWTPFVYKKGWIPNWIVASFPPIADSKGRRFRLELRSPAGTDDDPLLAWRCAELGVKHARMELDGTLVPGTLLFDYSFGRDAWENLGTVGDFTLHRWKPALGPYFAVSNALHSPSRKYSLVALTNRAFDPYRSVVLGDEEGAPVRDAAARMHKDFQKQRASEDGAEPETPTATAAEVLERGPNRVRLRVTHPEAGWLVACQTRYPGWRAEVDGAAAPLLPANDAFCAVPIPAGTCTVTLEYRPVSLRIGAAIALACAALGAGLWFKLSRAWAPR